MGTVPKKYSVLQTLVDNIVVDKDDDAENEEEEEEEEEPMDGEPMSEVEVEIVEPTRVEVDTISVASSSGRSALRPRRPPRRRARLRSCAGR